MLPAEGEGRSCRASSETSQKTQQLVDEEVRRLVESAHQEVTRLLSEHRDQLESLTQALLKDETLDAVEAYAAAGVPAHEPEADPAAV